MPFGIRLLTGITVGELPVLAASGQAASADASPHHRWHEKPPPRAVICYRSPVSGAAEVAKRAPSICFSRERALEESCNLSSAEMGKKDGLI